MCHSHGPSANESPSRPTSSIVWLILRVHETYILTRGRFYNPCSSSWWQTSMWPASLHLWIFHASASAGLQQPTCESLACPSQPSVPFSTVPIWLLVWAIYVQWCWIHQWFLCGWSLGPWPQKSSSDAGLLYSNWYAKHVASTVIKNNLKWQCWIHRVVTIWIRCGLASPPTGVVGILQRWQWFVHQANMPASGQQTIQTHVTFTFQAWRTHGVSRIISKRHVRALVVLGLAGIHMCCYTPC